VVIPIDLVGRLIVGTILCLLVCLLVEENAKPTHRLWIRFAVSMTGCAIVMYVTFTVELVYGGFYIPLPWDSGGKP
jgi:bacteriorhodopsin